MKKRLKRLIAFISAIAIVIASINYVPSNIEAATAYSSLTYTAVTGSADTEYCLETNEMGANLECLDNGDTVQLAYSADYAAQDTVVKVNGVVTATGGVVNYIGNGIVKIWTPSLDDNAYTEVYITSTGNKHIRVVFKKGTPVADGSFEDETTAAPTTTQAPIESSSQAESESQEPALNWQTDANLTAYFGENTKYAYTTNQPVVNGTQFRGGAFSVKEDKINFIVGAYGTESYVTLNGAQIGEKSTDYSLNRDCMYKDFNCGINTIQFIGKWTADGENLDVELTLYIDVPDKARDFLINDYSSMSGKYIAKFKNIGDSIKQYNVYVDGTKTNITIGGSGDYFTVDELKDDNVSNGNHTITLKGEYADGTETVASEGSTINVPNIEGTYGDIAQVYIQTDNTNLVAAPPAPEGKHVMQKVGDDKQMAAITVVDKDGIANPYECYEDLDKTTVKVRGNSTAGADKKAYNITFNKGKDLFGLDGSNKPAKKWSLLANAFDKSLIRNYLGFDIAHHMWANGTTPDYNSSSKFIDLYFNGRYLGNYLLIESVGIGKGRVDIDSENDESYNSDALMELENLHIDAAETNFTTKTYGQRFIFGSPETAKDIGGANSVIEEKTFFEKKQEDVATIFNDFETDLSNKDWTAIQSDIDVESFVKFYVVNEIMTTKDFNQSSTRFYVKDGKIYGGPLWDMDYSSDNNLDHPAYTLEYEIDDPGHSMPWFKHLMEIQDFRDLVVQEYKATRGYVISMYSDGGIIDSLLDDIEASALRNYLPLDQNGAGWSLTKADTGDGYGYMQMITNKVQGATPYTSYNDTDDTTSAIYQVKKYFEKRIEGLDQTWNVSFDAEISTDNNEVVVSWDSIQDATGYQLQFSGRVVPSPVPGLEPLIVQQIADYSTQTVTIDNPLATSYNLTANNYEVEDNTDIIVKYTLDSGSNYYVLDTVRYLEEEEYELIENWTKLTGTAPSGAHIYVPTQMITDGLFGNDGLRGFYNAGGTQRWGLTAGVGMDTVALFGFVTTGSNASSIVIDDTTYAANDATAADVDTTINTWTEITNSTSGANLDSNDYYIQTSAYTDIINTQIYGVFNEDAAPYMPEAGQAKLNTNTVSFAVKGIGEPVAEIWIDGSRYTNANSSKVYFDGNQVHISTDLFALSNGESSHVFRVAFVGPTSTATLAMKVEGEAQTTTAAESTTQVESSSAVQPSSQVEPSSEAESEPADRSWVKVPDSDDLYYNSDKVNTDVVSVQTPAWEGVEGPGVYLTVPAGVSAVTVNGADTGYMVTGAGVLVYLTALNDGNNTVNITYAGGEGSIILKKMADYSPTGLAATIDNGTANVAWTANANATTAGATYTVSIGNQSAGYHEADVTSNSATLDLTSLGYGVYDVILKTYVNGEVVDEQKITLRYSELDVVSFSGTGNQQMAWEYDRTDKLKWQVTGTNITGYAIYVDGDYYTTTTNSYYNVPAAVIAEMSGAEDSNHQLTCLGNHSISVLALINGETAPALLSNADAGKIVGTDSFELNLNYIYGDKKYAWNDTNDDSVWNFTITKGSSMEVDYLENGNVQLSNLVYPNNTAWQLKAAIYDTLLDVDDGETANVSFDIHGPADLIGTEIGIKTVSEEIYEQNGIYTYLGTKQGGAGDTGDCDVIYQDINDEVNPGIYEFVSDGNGGAVLHYSLSFVPRRNTYDLLFDLHGVVGHTITLENAESKNVYSVTKAIASPNVLDTSDNDSGTIAVSWDTNVPSNEADHYFYKVYIGPQNGNYTCVSENATLGDVYTGYELGHTYKVKVESYINDDGIINMTGEKTTEVTIPEDHLPNLVISDISIEGNQRGVDYVGETVPITVTMKNIGSADTTVTNQTLIYSLYVGRIVDGEFVPFDTGSELKRDGIMTVLGHTSGSNTISFTVNYNITEAGNIAFKAVADEDEVEDEASESDNTSIIRYRFYEKPSAAEGSDILGFQINYSKADGAASEFAPSFRTLARVSKVIDGEEITQYGFVYSGKGRDYVNKDNMVIDSEDSNISHIEANVKLNYNEWNTGDVVYTKENSNFYALTIKNMRYDSRDFTREYSFRTYYVKAGEVVYSDKIYTVTMEEIARSLYRNQKMQSVSAHNFLYDSILNIVAIRKNYKNIGVGMLSALAKAKLISSTSDNGYKWVNTYYKDLYEYATLELDYEYKPSDTSTKGYTQSDPFKSIMLGDETDTSTNAYQLLQLLNQSTGDECTTIFGWIEKNLSQYLEERYPYSWEKDIYIDFETELDPDE